MSMTMNDHVTKMWTWHDVCVVKSIKIIETHNVLDVHLSQSPATRRFHGKREKKEKTLGELRLMPSKGNTLQWQHLWVEIVLNCTVTAATCSRFLNYFFYLASCVLLYRLLLIELDYIYIAGIARCLLTVYTSSVLERGQGQTSFESDNEVKDSIDHWFTKLLDDCMSSWQHNT